MFLGTHLWHNVWSILFEYSNDFVMKAKTFILLLSSLYTFLATQIYAQEIYETPIIPQRESIGLFFYDGMAKVNIGGKYGFITLPSCNQ